MGIPGALITEHNANVEGIKRDIKIHAAIRLGKNIPTNVVYNYWYYRDPDDQHPDGGLYHIDRYAERFVKRGGKNEDRYVAKGWKEITPEQALEITERQWAAHVARVAEQDSDGTTSRRKK